MEELNRSKEDFQRKTGSLKIVKFAFLDSLAQDLSLKGFKKIFKVISEFLLQKREPEMMSFFSSCA